MLLTGHVYWRFSHEWTGMIASKSCYLAGPEVFMQNGPGLFARKTQLCATYGFVANAPDDSHVAARRQAGTDTLSLAIYQANTALMRASDVGIFDLTPFRGPSADAGTVFELGFMAGLGKPVFGYTNIAGDYIDRIAPRQRVDLHGQPDPLPVTLWSDAHGWMIENFGNADNLMIDSALAESGAPINRQATDLPTRFDDLAGFERCLQQAKQHFGAGESLCSAIGV